MKEISLTQNKVALVDDENYERLIQYKWFALKTKNNFYAVRNVVINDVRRSQQMHREIMGYTYKDGKMVDHKNRNGLDNRKENLRPADKMLNGVNCGMRSNNTSGYRGVYWDKWSRSWKAQIRVANVTKNCGRSLNVIEAARAYDCQAQKYWGDNAILNFPNGGLK
jgi:hypothetical protein